MASLMTRSLVISVHIFSRPLGFSSTILSLVILVSRTSSFSEGGGGGAGGGWGKAGRPLDSTMGRRARRRARRGIHKLREEALANAIQQNPLRLPYGSVMEGEDDDREVGNGNRKVKGKGDARSWRVLAWMLAWAG